jgi:hypothetical protein
LPQTSIEIIDTVHRVTGRGTQIAATHLRSLERFDFDAVLIRHFQGSGIRF